MKNQQSFASVAWNRKGKVTRREGMMRRRSKIEQVVRREDIAAAPGLREACEILFGEEAEARLQEYIDALTRDPRAAKTNPVPQPMSGT